MGFNVFQARAWSCSRLAWPAEAPGGHSWLVLTHLGQALDSPDLWPPPKP